MRNHLKETHPFTQPPNHHEKPPKITLSGARGWVRDNLKKILFFLRFASSFPWDIRGKPASIEEKRKYACAANANAILSCRTRSNVIPPLYNNSVLFCSLPSPKKNWKYPGQTPHQCDVCGKKYTRKEHLANHMRSHTNETPFRCEICGKSFSRKEHFTNHILWHTGKETKRIGRPCPSTDSDSLNPPWSVTNPAQSLPRADDGVSFSPHEHMKYHTDRHLAVASAQAAITNSRWKHQGWI